MQKIRVLYILDSFPQLSQTYIKTEIKYLCEQYDIRVVCCSEANVKSQTHYPYTLLRDIHHLGEIIQEFSPNVLHGHYMTSYPVLLDIAEQFKIPFTLRAHSFDVLGSQRKYQESEFFLGVLAFPFFRPILEHSGLSAARIVDCYPVVDYAMFHDNSCNGFGILNLGACLPKKRFEDFFDLSVLMPHRDFELYPIGYNVHHLEQQVGRYGKNLRLMESAQHQEMPRIYKRHQWLVYTACPVLKTVGWPMAIAEAQAAGLGVCMPNIRSDLLDYIGGAGILYNSIEELPQIISHEYPEEMRERGFVHAQKSDIATHKRKLSDLWDGAVLGR